MMEPVSTSVVSGSAAATASATAGTTASAAGGASATEAARQAAIVRQLASTFVKSAELQTVRDSEIIDEFASPIYAGLAMAPSGQMTTIKTPGLLVSPPIDNSPVPEVLGPMGTPTEKVPAPIVSSDPATPAPAKKPAVRELLDRQYDTPTIREQLDAGESTIVVERRIVDEKVVDNGNQKSAVCLIEERVIDRKYFGHGNLTDLISEIRHGHIPTIRQLYLAVVDLADLATFKLFQPLFLRAKLEPAKYRLRQISADIQHKEVFVPSPKQDRKTFSIDRQVEKRGWFKPDHVIEKNGHVEVNKEKSVEIKVLNAKSLCTVEFDKEQCENLKSRRQELEDMLGDGKSLVRIENLLPPDAIADINCKAMAWVHERVVTTTSRHVTTEEFTRAFGKDLGGLLGKRVDASDAVITEEVQDTVSEYLSPSDMINLDKIDTYQQAVDVFSSLQKTATVKFDSKTVDSFVVPGNGTTFKDGWITYVPGGSLVTLVSKKDLGCNLTGWDVFWAGVDVATLALAVGAVAKSGAKAAAVGVAKGSTKAAAQGGAKVAAQGAAKGGVKGAAQSVAKGGAKAAVQGTAKGGAKAAVQGAAKGSANVGTTGVVKGAATNSSKAAAKNGLTQSGMVKIKNAGGAGAKAKPAIGISRPEITYKNIPRNNGSWTGIPGNSTWKPTPNAIPSNPMVNPNGKRFSTILRENNMRNGIPFKRGFPDFGNGTKATVKIDNLIVKRPINFGKGDSILAQQVRNGKAEPSIVRGLKRMGVNPKHATKGDISRFRRQFNLTWHEHQNGHTLQLIPKELHGTIPHKGGISVLKEKTLPSARHVGPTSRNSMKTAYQTTIYYPEMERSGVSLATTNQGV